MHLPQVPFPPHGESILIPAFLAASRSSVPAGISIVLPEGLNLMIGILSLLFELGGQRPQL
jgi:hypothetical protein